MYSLQDLGWGPFFQNQISDPPTGLFPARVAGHSRGIYRLLSASGDLTASVAGRLAHEATQSAALPVVGDWVLARLASPGQAVIDNVLERRTKLSRIAPGERTEEQILATNVDDHPLMDIRHITLDSGDEADSDDLKDAAAERSDG